MAEQPQEYQALDPTGLEGESACEKKQNIEIPSSLLPSKNN